MNFRFLEQQLFEREKLFYWWGGQQRLLLDLHAINLAAAFIAADNIIRHSAAMAMDLAANSSVFRKIGTDATKWTEYKNVNYQSDKAHKGLGLEKLIEK